MVCLVQIRNETFRCQLLLHESVKSSFKFRERDKDDAPHWSQMIRIKTVLWLYCTSNISCTLDRVAFNLPHTYYKWFAATLIFNKNYLRIIILIKDLNIICTKFFFAKIGLKDKSSRCFADKNNKCDAISAYGISAKFISGYNSRLLFLNF